MNQNPQQWQQPQQWQNAQQWQQPPSQQPPLQSQQPYLRQAPVAPVRRRGKRMMTVGGALLALAVSMAVVAVVLMQRQLNSIQEGRVDMAGDGIVTSTTVDMAEGEKRTVYRLPQSFSMECDASNGATVKQLPGSAYTTRGLSVRDVAEVTATQSGKVTISCTAAGDNADSFIGKSFDNTSFGAKIGAAIGGVLLGFVGLGLLLVGLVQWFTTKPPTRV